MIITDQITIGGVSFHRQVYYPAETLELAGLGTRDELAAHRHARTGIAFYRVNAGLVLYRGSDIIAWIDRHRVETEPPPLRRGRARKGAVALKENP